MPPKAFLSYSHSDRDTAESIARLLMESGVDVWWDNWEIAPGDSIVRKIFSEGLSNVDAFIILLSKQSVDSSWVREELDFATVRRIEGITRIVPLLKEQCDIPAPLRTLRWVDLTRGLEEGILTVAKSLHGQGVKPPLGDVPRYVTELAESVGGLSRIASTVGASIVRADALQQDLQRTYGATAIAELVPPLNPKEVNDAIEELEECGLVKVVRAMGTAPFRFAYVEPTYALYLHFESEGLDYDPVSDIKIVATTVEAKEHVRGPELQELSGLPTGRLNHAVAYLADYGWVQTRNFLGTAPYRFGVVSATRKTREFVETNCR